MDFTHSELMDRLKEALKTYCICGGKDDDSFMIQCDDCEDWFHGRCVNVDEFKGVDCIERAVEEMVFVCPKCCNKRDRPYRFHPGYRPPRDEATEEKHQQARKQRMRLLKERRRQMAEAAEHRSKKRPRKAQGKENRQKKAKLNMQDAESFVDRMKQRFARSPGQYDRFLLILQVRRAPPAQWRAANLTRARANARMRQEYATQRRTLETVYESMGELLRGHPDLQ